MTVLLAQGKLSWTQAFIGLRHVDHGRDFDGVDCWGLPKPVYRERAGIDLPAYDGDYLDGPERREIDALIAGAPSPIWALVSRDVLSRDVRELDLAAFRDSPYRIHVGIVLRPGLMLHVARQDCAKIEDYRGGQWSKRLIGVWRHAQLAGKAVRP
jgi:probable lipoprotein NlpC